MAKNKKAALTYVGRPCREGHTVRYASTRHCVMCTSTRDAHLQATSGMFRGRRWECNIMKSARTRAKEGGVPFDQEAVLELVRAAPDTCPVLGTEFVVGGRNGGGSPASPSIDRFVPELGYVRGNMAVVSRRANMIKSDATLEQIEAVASWMRNHKNQET